MNNLPLYVLLLVSYKMHSVLKSFNSSIGVTILSLGFCRISLFINNTLFRLVRQFTEEDLDNPKLMAAIDRSMLKWGKNK